MRRPHPTPPTAPRHDAAPARARRVARRRDRPNRPGAAGSRRPPHPASPHRLSDRASAIRSAQRDRAQPASRRPRTSAWRAGKPAHAGARRLRAKNVTLAFTGIRHAYGAHRGAARHRPVRRAGGDRLPARRLGLRQDHAAAPGGGARAAAGTARSSSAARSSPNRGGTCRRNAAACRLRVPGLRAVPASDGGRERRLRPALRAARASAAGG